MGGFEELEPVLRAHLPHLDHDRPLECTASLTELGLDSIGTMELLADIEETFAIVLPEEALTVATFATPDAVWTAVRNALSRQSP